MSRRNGTNPRAVLNNPRQLGRSPRSSGTNPRALAANPRVTTSTGDPYADEQRAAIDARHVRTTIARALRRMRTLGDECRGCGGRSTLDHATVCTCEPVSYRAAVEYLAESARM